MIALHEVVTLKLLHTFTDFQMLNVKRKYIMARGMSVYIYIIAPFARQ